MKDAERFYTPFNKAVKSKNKIENHEHGPDARGIQMPDLWR